MKGFISAIIPVYNDPEGIKTTLESLISQNYPRDRFEIIVVDNNSPDNTRDIVGDFIKRYPKSVSLLVEDKIQSSYAARNKAIQVAKGEILAFIDSDMWAGKSWFSFISSSFNDRKVGYLGFSIEIHPTGTSLAGIYNKLTGFPVEEYMNTRHFAGAGCIAVRKSVFKKVGLFDQKLISGGDSEFGNRVWEAGIGQIFIGGDLLHHPARESVSSLFKKEFRIGRGHRQLRNHFPLINLLPPNPLKFFDRRFYSEKDLKISDFSKADILILYLLGLGSKVTRNLGYFYEAIRNEQK